MKRTLLLLTLAVFTLFLQAQPVANSNTLLWRISHPQMEKSSYLYGTMHLQDKRLFHFTDSLYASIRSVEGFAGELDMSDMNELVTSWIKKEVQESAQPVYLKDHISSSLKKKYKSALEKKFRKPFQDISFKELQSAANDWDHIYRKEDDMPTFVDAFLFGIARDEGKWIGALEQVKDQLDDKPADLESLIKAALVEDKKRLKMMEDFIAIYLSADLSRMNEIMVKASGEQDHLKMNFRNTNMVQKMDSLAAIRSCFYAVGAAHLPGDSGIIQLLRNKGYIVDPVHSTQKLEPALYLNNKTAANWQEISWANGDFKIKMPGNPSSIDGMGGFQHARIYFDPMSMSGFMTGFIPMDNKTEAEIDSTCMRLPEIYATDGVLYRDSVWQINGKKAYEIEASTKDGYMNMMVNPVPGGIVMNMIISMSKAGLKMNNAAGFFSSFVSNKKVAPPVKKGWRSKIIVDRQIFYESPVELQLTSSKGDSSWFTNTYTAVEPESQMFYSISTMTTVPGLYSSLDSLYFEELLDQYRNNDDYKLMNYALINVKGFPGVSMLLGAKPMDDSVHYQFNVINRGNRRYALLVGYIPNEKNKAEADRFINSVRFLPFVALKSGNGAIPHENFRIESPFMFAIDTSVALAEGTRRFMMYDSVSAVSMHLEKEKLNRYYYAANDSLFFNDQLGYFKTAADSLVRFEIKTVNNTKLADAWIDLDGTHNKKRVRLMASGDTLYSLVGIMSDEVMKTAAYQKIFDSFQLIEQRTNSYTQSKGRIIFNDLLLPDSLIFNEAKAALGTVELSQEDLPLLHAALLHPMADFNERKTCAHDELISRVLDFKDPSTIRFIKQAYPELRERNAVLQYPLLSILARFNTQECYKEIENLLATGLPTAGNPGILYGSMQDSMDLSIQLFPVVLKYKNDSLLRKIIPGFALALKKEARLTEQEWQEIRPVILSLADEYQEALKDKNLPMPVYFEDLLEMLTQDEDPSFKKRLEGFIYHPNEDIQYSAVKTLVVTGKNIPAKVLQDIAADPFYRSPLYYQLEQVGKTKLFPKKNRKQEAIAESHLYRNIWYGEEEYQLKYLKQVQLLIEGEKQYYYLFRVSFTTEEGVENYLGVAGPYTSKSAINTTPGELTGVYYDELLDESNLTGQLEAFIQSQQ